MNELELVTTGYHAETLARDETLFHCANGYLGVRGCFEEGAKNGDISVRGTYINGFCEEEEICYGERLYGFPDSKQVMVNLPDAQSVHLWAGGKQAAAWSDFATGMTRRLDFASGFASREYEFDTGCGRLKVSVTRMASFALKELFLLRFCVTSIDYSGAIRLDSLLNGDVANFSDPDDPRVASETRPKLTINRRLLEGGCLALCAQTLASKRVLGCAVLHEMDGAEPELFGQGNLLAARFSRSIRPGETLALTKYCVYTDAPENGDLLEVAISLVRQAAQKGFGDWANEQLAYLSAFWRRSRVKISGDARTQAYLDLCVYELLCAAGQNGRSSVAAKGLSGEGYEGHYFWDCETYAFPFFLMSAPEMAKKLLDYRYEHLDEARAHARLLGHERGALYPWRTITGSECSAYYPSGSAQYHINADIAHAFCQYWYATRDIGYLPRICEVLVETARLFLDAGHMREGLFRIDGVTGPDEYTCIVDNNYYTNAGAANTFLEATSLCHLLDANGGFDALSEKIGVTKAELAQFSATGSSMYLPMDQELGICKQDDSFLNKKRWNLDEIPPDHFPLLMHYHPLYINRHQVCKQADTVLAHFLYREESPLVLRRTYAYYEQVTTHDSSLSACVFSMMAARLGDLARALRYFEMTVGIDMEDQSGNTRDGLHIANMGGAYLSVIAGFGGMRLSKNGLSLFPLLPDGWTGYSFPLLYQKSRFSVAADREGCTVRLIEGEETEITVYDQKIRATKSGTRVRRPVRAVIFDLDGVVTDTARFHYAAWKRIADELGIPFDETRNERFKGVSRMECLNLLLEAGGRNLSAEEKNGWADRKNAYYIDALSALTKEDILPGVPDALSVLKANKIPCALFSVSKNTDFILEKLDLTGAFNAVVTGRDITHSKPHFEGYLLAAERLGIDPRLCLMVEDAEAGLSGARALAMRTIGIGAGLPAGAADSILPDTLALGKALEGFLFS
ncbi:MAG: beta-phosphoglucomutase [Clostridiaceae bacterium]